MFRGFLLSIAGYEGRNGSIREGIIKYKIKKNTQHAKHVGRRGEEEERKEKRSGERGG